MNSSFIYNNLKINYEPFPIGYFQPALPENFYKTLCDTFPDIGLFEYKEHLGHKYSLSETNNPENYHSFIQQNSIWQKFYNYVKSPDFIIEVVRLLENKNINLDLIPPGDLTSWKRKQEISRLVKKISLNKISLARHNLKTRFEFSALPASNGSIKPHTDAPNKLITLVLTITDSDSWDKKWGGGTEMNKPKDTSKNFNFLNDQLDFDEVQPLNCFDFNPNQCLLFVKTFNSWHCVRPMTGPEGVLRKTLTINIEEF